MPKTKIEWCDFTINPVKGLCPVDCKDNQGKSYCYARAMYKRFKWNPEIRFEWNFTPPRKPSKIFVGSTMELFGEWVPDGWMRTILKFCSQWPEHTFLFLTKQPQDLTKFKFPDNCWVGVSATNATMFVETDGLSPVTSRGSIACIGYLTKTDSLESLSFLRGHTIYTVRECCNHQTSLTRIPLERNAILSSRRIA